MKLLIRFIVFVLGWGLEVHVSYSSPSSGPIPNSDPAANATAPNITMLPEGCWDGKMGRWNQFPCAIHVKSKRPVEIQSLRIASGSVLVAQAQNRLHLNQGRMAWVPVSGLNSESSNEIVIVAQGLEFSTKGSGFLAREERSIRWVNLGEESLSLSLSVGEKLKEPTQLELPSGMQWKAEMTPHRVATQDMKFSLPKPIEAQALALELLPLLKLNRSESLRWVERLAKSQQSAQTALFELHRDRYHRTIATLDEADRSRRQKEAAFEAQRERLRKRFRDKFFGDPFRFD